MFLDYDECAFGNACEDGVCVNTAGSFNCFCSPPLVLDTTRRRCIGLNTTEGVTHKDTHTFVSSWISRDLKCDDVLHDESVNESADKCKINLYQL